MLVAAWSLAAGAVVAATVLLEMLAWQPLHRGDYAAAEPLLDAGAALSRAGTWIHVPGQRARLAAYLGDLAEAREQQGAIAEAEQLYLESIAVFETEFGPEDSHTRHARWRYESFLRSTGHTDDRPES